LWNASSVSDLPEKRKDGKGKEEDRN